MKKSKAEKDAEKLAKLLGLQAPTAVSKAEANARSMEAEAALEYYENPRSFSEKNCKQCGRSFATRGAPVAYCSDDCRVRAFEERMGVKWQPLRPTTERWGFMGEPLVVPHEALLVVQAAMVREQEAREGVSGNDSQDELREGEGDGGRDGSTGGTGESAELDPDTLDLLAELGL